MALLSRIILTLSVVSPFLECKKLCFDVKGIISPVFTPVDDNGMVDLDVVRPYAQYLKDQEVNGVLVAGITGEGLSLNVTDKKNLIDAWVKAAESLKLSVMVQVGGIPLPDAQELAAYAEAAGSDAILTLPDLYYTPKTPKELVYYVQEIAQAAPETPVLYYHTPEKTGVDVDMVEFLQLATERIYNFKGFKSDDFGTSLMLQDKLMKDQKIFIANSLYLAPAVFMGFENFIMSEINVFPKLVRYIVYNGKRGYYRKARLQYRRLRILEDIISKNIEDNALTAQKEAMPMLTGINVGSIRPPAMPLTFEEIIRLENRLTKENIEIIDSALDEDCK